MWAQSWAHRAAQGGERNRRKVHLVEIAENYSVVFELMVFECEIGVRRQCKSGSHS